MASHESHGGGGGGGALIESALFDEMEKIGTDMIEAIFLFHLIDRLLGTHPAGGSHGGGH